MPPASSAMIFGCHITRLSFSPQIWSADLIPWASSQSAIPLIFWDIVCHLLSFHESCRCFIAHLKLDPDTGLSAPGVQLTVSTTDIGNVFPGYKVYGKLFQFLDDMDTPRVNNNSPTVLDAILVYDGRIYSLTEIPVYCL